MRALLLLFICVNIILVGCSQSNHSNHVEDQIPKMLEVSFELPDEIGLNEEIQIEAVVSQGNVAVEDAKEVLFEVGKITDEEGEKITATNMGNGVYYISTSFLNEGEYFVIAHVTARNMHTMPKKFIKVISK